jgi:hypothetical protein
VSPSVALTTAAVSPAALSSAAVSSPAAVLSSDHPQVRKRKIALGEFKSARTKIDEEFQEGSSLQGYFLAHLHLSSYHAVMEENRMHMKRMLTYRYT